jgi:hypothetical protein
MIKSPTGLPTKEELNKRAALTIPSSVQIRCLFFFNAFDFTNASSNCPKKPLKTQKTPYIQVY